MEKQQILQKRKNLFKLASKTTLVKKGNRRLHNQRLCSICGRVLTRYIATEQQWYCISPHYRLNIENLLELNLCQDIKSCYNHLKPKENQHGNY